MKLLKAVPFFMAFLLVALLSVSTAYADYNPTLQSPTNGATLLSPDGTTFTWTSGSDIPDKYLVQWSLKSDFSTLLFEYETPSLSYSLVGLPGIQKIYWRVLAVDSEENTYPSAVWSFTTTMDGENAVGQDQDYFTKLDFEDNNSQPAGWTNSNTGYLYTYSYNYTYHLRAYCSGSGSNLYLTYNTPITINKPNSVLQYQWARYTNTSYTDNMLIQFSTDGSNFFTFYDHRASNNYTYFTSGSSTYYSYGMKTETHSLDAYFGQTIYLRFSFIAGSSPYYPFFLNDVEMFGKEGYEGSARTVTVYSQYGTPNPAGIYSIPYGSTENFSLESSVAYPAGDPTVRYNCTSFYGTGSVPLSGNPTNVVATIYRTSTIIFLWNVEYLLSVQSMWNMGSPNPGGDTWIPDGDSVTCFLEQPYVDGVSEATRWACVGWSGTGSIPGYGIASTVTISDFSASSTIEWLWEVQYRLVIENTNGDEIGNISPAAGTYWYFEGDTQYVMADTFYVASEYAAFRCLGWEGVGTVEDSSSNAGVVTISQPSILTWQWEQNYFLTITSEYGQTMGNSPGWYATGSVLECAVYVPYEVSEIARYNVFSWEAEGSLGNGNGQTTGTFVFTEPTFITWNWSLQYLVEFTSNYGSVDTTSAWVTSGASITVSAIAPEETEVSRFAWNGWTGTGIGDTPTGSSTTEFIINQPSEYKAWWSSQFYLNVSSNIGSFDENYTGWYDKFTVVPVVATPPTAYDGKRFVCAWVGTGEGSVSLEADPANEFLQSIEILEPIVQMVVWEVQYRLILNNEAGFGEPQPSAGVYWFFDGDIVEGRIDFFSGTHYCVGYEGTGSVASSSNTFYSFIITEPSTVSFEWELPVLTSGDDWTAPSQITSGVKGRNVVLRRSSDGSPFVAFHNPVTKTIEACYWNGTAWVGGTIETVGAEHCALDMFLDEYDVPFLVFRNAITNSLRYATLSSSGWTKGTIDTGNGIGTYISLDAADNGTIGVAYYDFENGSLKYAYYRPGTVKADSKIDWIIDVIDDNGNVGLYCSLKYSKFWSEPKIAYYSSTEAKAYIATLPYSEEAWTICAVSQDGSDQGVEISLGLDPSGAPLVVFQDNTVETNQQGLIFSRELSAAWQIYSLDSAGITGFDPCMVVDSYGFPRVVYNNFGSLFYARYDGEGWVITEVDEGEIGYGSSLALDGDDNAAICYWKDGCLQYVDVEENSFKGEIVNYYTVVAAEDVEDTSTSGGGGCFIATAAFGSMAVNEVSTLCVLRDTSISTSAVGSGLISQYYSLSPEVASELILSPSSRCLVRGLLKPE